mmetsp:Transcript_82639/g.146379  ORF Transcript_82639/g.146379 Transcript_82639/m.146379 type:complete len:262 (+) Transcript_82639:37-822(+)
MAESVAPPDENIEDLLKAVDGRPQDTYVHEELCETVGKLAAMAAKPDEKKAIAKLRGITVLLQAMQKHLAVAGVQEQGCAALKNLASDPDNERAIGELEGIKAVIRSMDKHPEVAGVQQQACGALWNLGFCVEHKKQIVRYGGLDAVLRAMEQHVEVKPVQEQAFGVLRKILESEDRSIQAEVVERGGVGAVQRGLAKHAMSPFMVEHGAWLWFHFTWLSNHNENCSRELMEHGAQDTALKAVGKPFYKVPKPQLDIRAAP